MTRFYTVVVIVVAASILIFLERQALLQHRTIMMIRRTKITRRMAAPAANQVQLISTGGRRENERVVSLSLIYKLSDIGSNFFIELKVVSVILAKG